MLEPAVEARLLQELQVQRHEKVLEDRHRLGFMAALLAHRAQQVITLEMTTRTGRVARDNLQRAGVHNAEVRVGDGAAGTQVDGPFDVIVLSGLGGRGSPGCWRSSRSAGLGRSSAPSRWRATVVTRVSGLPAAPAKTGTPSRRGC
jgi:protein-L-isoaspartate(D-aspartate) O-methyltransferase